MLLLIDLDGTIINTVHPSWKPYKDGQDNCSIEPHLAQLPFVYGARDFLTSRRTKGDDIVIVSDSHFRYVNPICNMLNVECVPLSDKPNTSKLNQYLDTHPNFKQDIELGNCVVIGDSTLDIELGRHIGVMTIWFLPYIITEEIKDAQNGIGDEMSCKKMGPTFTAKTFEEISQILDSPLTHLYAVEAAFMDCSSTRSIRFGYNQYRDGSYACIRCLARQEQGACDKYARGDKYYMTSNFLRTNEFKQTLAKGISNYINFTSQHQKWDYFTYMTDKRTTTPTNKMKEIFDIVETTIPKVQLLKWSDNVEGSLRSRNLYQDRQSFLQKYLTIECPFITTIDGNGTECKQELSLSGKNIVVLDDQLTTSATAYYVIKQLKNKGAKNVLFIAIFQMILPVNNDVVCPKCGKQMLIKMRRSDGHRFYSCTPPQFRGSGCGYIIDIEKQSAIDKKFVDIQQMYKWGFDSFKKGRDHLPNFKQLVIDSEEKIKLIEEMGMYGTSATDDNIKKMKHIKNEWLKLVSQKPIREKYYAEFGYTYFDYWDSFGYLIEYAIEHIEELDAYIEKCNKLK